MANRQMEKAQDIEDSLAAGEGLNLFSNEYSEENEEYYRWKAEQEYVDEDFFCGYPDRAIRGFD